MDAIVADAQLPNAVAGLRALDRAGVRAVAVGPSRAAGGLWSRHAAGREAGELVTVLARHGPAVVYPAQEPTIDTMLELDAPRVVLPWDPASLERLRDKRLLPALAGEHGLRAPATLFEGAAADLPGLDAQPPFVVKPPRGTQAFPTARLVASAAELRELADALPPAETVLVQERLTGRLGSLALVLDRDGRVAARFQEEALRTWPRGAGTFAATVSVPPDEGLVERVAAMLRATDFWGLAQLDVVTGAGNAAVLDVNARFYLCMPLALHCGVNLPAAWHAVVAGEAAGAPRSYPAGRRYRDLEGDLYAARRGHARALLRPRPRAQAGAMWAADDPLASVMLALNAATGPVRRRRRERAGRG